MDSTTSWKRKDHILHCKLLFSYRPIICCEEAENQQSCNISSHNRVVTKHEVPFTVIPKCKDGSEGTESGPSIPIVTAATSPPGIPQPTAVAQEQITLKWTPPDIGGENVSYYCVYYRQLDYELWKCESTTGNRTYITIGGLDQSKHYQFKVKAVCKSDCANGGESKACDFVKSCVTGKLRVKDKTHDSITLVWDKPHYEYEQVNYYEVQYKEEKLLAISWHKVRATKEAIMITNLQHNTEYVFRVRPVCNDNTIFTPFCRNERFRTKDKPLAIDLFENCPHGDRFPASSKRKEVCRIPKLRQVMKNDAKRIAKYHIGTHSPGTPEKVIILVGATGAGKSTLINSIANYLLGVSEKMPFRFILIEEEELSQAHSQSSWITAYTFHAQRGSPVQYDITVIDTPGFGDTKGVERDKEITKHIKEFFSVKPPYGIDSIHAIGFVAQAALARLTPTQKYVFDSILSIFGKDIANNIFLMSTFADGEPPQVLAAIKEANIDCKKCFEFNNSVLYVAIEASTRPQFSHLFWNMNDESFKTFFRTLRNTSPISLQLTKEVLEKREHLETLIRGLQEKIRMVLDLIQEMQQEEKILKDLNIYSPDFTYEVDVVKTRQVKLEEGLYITNCMNCNFTCHFPCTISENEKKYNCASMEGSWLRRGKDSMCKVCPGKCHWTLHKQNDYRIEYYTEKETRGLKDLMKRYLEDSEGSSETESESVTDMMLSNAKSKLKVLNNEVMLMIKQTQQCLKRLNEIAYKPHPLDEVAYIDVMIESEMREAKEGYTGRVSALQRIKDEAKLLSTIKQTAETGPDFDEQPARAGLLDMFASIVKHK